MGQDISIASLRARVTALVERESALLTQAFELSRAAADRGGVDALFAQVQAIQVERNSLKQQIGNVLGNQRLHVASEVWKPGVYEYGEEVGGDRVRVRVTRGPLGLQVFIPDRPNAVSIDMLKGTFDGPLAVDDAVTADRSESPTPRQADVRGRLGKKNPV